MKKSLTKVSPVALAIGMMWASSAWAQTPSQTPSVAEKEADVVIVTGTRRTDRTLADSAVPIDVIGAQAIASNGSGDTNKILNSLVPSFNFPQPSVTDGTDTLRPATLRGLAPDQTLVLINGRRRHVSALLNINNSVGRGSAAVDLNTIPSLAIERIEVLRDGASSQYGSDAIAGVINIQLKRQSSGGRVVASYGMYSTTLDGVANVTGLQTNGSGQPILDPTDPRNFLANTQGERTANDGELLTLGANIGFSIGEEGFVNLTAEYRDRAPTNRAAFDLRPNYNRPTAAFDPRELTFNRLNFKYGDAETQDLGLFLNSELPVGEVTLYAFASYSKRDGLSSPNFRQQSVAANRDWSTLTPSTVPNAQNFVPLRPDGFLPSIATDLTDSAATVGAKLDAAGWAVNMSLGYGRNDFDFEVRDSLSTAFGPQSQSTFDAGGLGYGHVIANADLSREYEVGFSEPLSVAFGAEYRKENFELRPGDLQSYAAGPLLRAPFVTTAANCTTQQGVFNLATSVCGFPGRAAGPGSQGFPGIPASSATNVSRDSYAAYVELDTNPLKGLTTTLAARYESYSDFGETASGKLALRYEPVEGYAVRGSISNGFRAPSLHQQFFTTTSTNFINGAPVEVSTLAVDSAVARALGASDLKPETSRNFSIGATANPVSGLTFTIDYYDIKISDRIVLTETLGAAGAGTAAVNAAVKALLDANGFTSVGAARFFINGLDTTTTGLDIVASYRLNLETAGKWNLSLAYNLNESTIDKRINNLGPLATIPNITLFGRLEGIRFTAGQPRDKIVLSADGKLGIFGVTARTTRYGEVISPGNTNPISDPTSLTLLGPDDAVLSPKWITDLEFKMTLNQNIDLAIGVNNLFDVYPDRLPNGARSASIGGAYPINQTYFPYSNFSPFGFNGRFLYARVGVNF